MSITSLNFVGFVLLTLLFYHSLPQRSQTYLLLGVSYIFYATWSWWYLLVLWVLTLINFWLIHRVRRDDQPQAAMLWLAVGVNLVALAILKYEDFFLPELRRSFNQINRDLGYDRLRMLLPAGMSFYIVAVIASLVDTYRGQTPAPDDPVDFAVYMAYFPKLLAGPIERTRDFLPRLARPRALDQAALSSSLTLVAVGVVRKVVIADTLFNTFPQDLWRHPERHSGPELTGYLLIYAFALYNDFAGYTNIARGVSGLFGIELAENFNLPYVARNFTEFWNRWHITLSHWLRDYIYYPSSRALLRRNPRRDNIPNLIVPPMLTMLASGLWHGTGWAMMLWGGLHGLYLVGERVLAFRRPARPPQRQPRWRQALAAGTVFVLVTLAWVPFRVESLSATFDYWQGMLDWTDPRRPSYRAFIALLPALWLDWVLLRHGSVLVFLRWPRLVRATLLALAALAVFLLSQADTGAPFVYQGF